ncbi:uncharacterized protein LOC120563185 [Perca fluviatilis]|uniref:uncharacterized protein LOC120563185 n=1 Tax=Perca fluviatilis TaxID=8168 RepID=UPI0019636C1A|nr:uncharacterized protein LOC120563185 [Perca fluviatilis]
MVSNKMLLSAGAGALALLAFYGLNGGLYINLMILFAVAVAVYLLAVSVESPAEEEEIRLYDAPVFKAEKMKRPLKVAPIKLGPVSHSGVRVTIKNGSRWLVHKLNNSSDSSDTLVGSARDMRSNGKGLVIKGNKYINYYVNNYGDSPDTVVISAPHLRSDWTLVQTKDFNGTKTVGRMLKDAGYEYSLLSDNCHHAADRMMND